MTRTCDYTQQRLTDQEILKGAQRLGAYVRLHNCFGGNDPRKD